MRLALLQARYGEQMAGGAERLARGLAEEAGRHGWKVEVWTTCALSYETWENVLPAGHEQLNGVDIRRFPVDPWDSSERHKLNKLLTRQAILSVPDQYRWVEAGPSSAALYEHVQAHAGDFDLVLLMPYLHALTYRAAWLVPEQLVLWPCLHDEVFAYMQPYHLLLEAAWAVCFLSPEEADLAVSRLGLHLPRRAVTGSGVDAVAVPAPVVGSTSPYLLYVGRLDAGKGVPMLYEYVTRMAAEGDDVQLVIVGNGPCRPPEHPAFDYRGFVSEAEKAGLTANALALCQPSVNESFSLVMMESWLLGRPALVNADCAVTRGHVERAAGGVTFRGYAEFRDAVRRLRSDPEQARQMGRNGGRYVRENYQWPVVFRRFEEHLRRWMAAENVVEQPTAEKR